MKTVGRRLGRRRKNREKMRAKGLEPIPLARPGPKPGASANSAMPAEWSYHKGCPAVNQSEGRSGLISPTGQFPGTAEHQFGPWQCAILCSVFDQSARKSPYSAPIHRGQHATWDWWSVPTSGAVGKTPTPRLERAPSRYESGAGPSGPGPTGKSSAEIRSSIHIDGFFSALRRESTLPVISSTRS